jgi:monoamine oxidase
VQNRRQFIQKISIVSGSSLCLAALSTSTLLQSCTTIDEYLITDPNDLKEHVVIVGGGITGLYAAYQLKKRKIPYKIFESSHRLGGKFLSNQNYEYGAFEFLSSDKNMQDLAKEQIQTRGFLNKEQQI